MPVKEPWLSDKDFRLRYKKSVVSIGWMKKDTHPSMFCRRTPDDIFVGVVIVKKCDDTIAINSDKKVIFVVLNSIDTFSS